MPSQETNQPEELSPLAHNKSRHSRTQLCVIIALTLWWFQVVDAAACTHYSSINNNLMSHPHLRLSSGLVCSSTAAASALVVQLLLKSIAESTWLCDGSRRSGDIDVKLPDSNYLHETNNMTTSRMLLCTIKSDFQSQQESILTVSSVCSGSRMWIHHSNLSPPFRTRVWNGRHMERSC